MLPALDDHRMARFDFSSSALYFVSTSVQAWRTCLGEVLNGTMWPNEYGNIAAEHWRGLERQFTFVILHAFVVMPNQLHAILEIDTQWLPPNAKVKSLGDLMAAYKKGSSDEIQETGLHDFGWQHSFLEIRIGDEESYESISRYISSQPAHWVNEALLDVKEHKSPPVVQKVR
jgi:putative transposase